MIEAGWFDSARFDRRPIGEFLNDEIPADDNQRWKREVRITNIKRIAKGHEPL